MRQPLGIILRLAVLLPVADAMGLLDDHSLGSTIALLGRPVVQTWTPESEHALPFGPIFDELRRKLDLRPFSIESGMPGGVFNWSYVIEWVLNEDIETARGIDWADSLKHGGREAEEYRYPGILVVGVPGGIAEQMLLPIMTYFASVGRDLPRLFFLPLGTSPRHFVRCTAVLARCMCVVCQARWRSRSRPSCMSLSFTTACSRASRTR